MKTPAALMIVCIALGSQEAKSQSQLSDADQLVVAPQELEMRGSVEINSKFLTLSRYKKVTEKPIVEFTVSTIILPACIQWRIKTSVGDLAVSYDREKRTTEYWTRGISEVSDAYHADDPPLQASLAALYPMISMIEAHVEDQKLNKNITILRDREAIAERVTTSILTMKEPSATSPWGQKIHYAIRTENGQYNRVDGTRQFSDTSGTLLSSDKHFEIIFARDANNKFKPFSQAIVIFEYDYFSPEKSELARTYRLTITSQTTLTNSNTCEMAKAKLANGLIKRETGKPVYRLEQSRPTYKHGISKSIFILGGILVIFGVVVAIIKRFK